MPRKTPTDKLLVVTRKLIDLFSMPLFGVGDMVLTCEEGGARAAQGVSHHRRRRGEDRIVPALSRPRRAASASRVAEPEGGARRSSTHWGLAAEHLAMVKAWSKRSAPVALLSLALLHGALVLVL